MFDPSEPAHARALHRLASEEVIWLTTVSQERMPQPSPVWFWWDGREVWVYSGGTSRIANIRSSPQVSLNFDTQGDGDEENIVIIEGTALLDEQAPRADKVPAYVERYDKLVKANNMTWDSFCDHYRVPVRILPTGFRGW